MFADDFGIARRDNSCVSTHLSPVNRRASGRRLRRHNRSST